MLRLLILLECDECKEMLSSTPNVGSNGLGPDWSEEIYAMECEAEQTGWSVYRSQHVCDVCVFTAMSKQQLECTDGDIPF